MMKQYVNGLIVKLVRGIYYVKIKEETIPCKARGLFRELDITPLVGDKVEVRYESDDQMGYIEKVLPRTSLLLRPTVANVDQVLIVVSIKDPDINLNLLDKYLLMVEKEGLEAIICLNKIDLADSDEIERIKKTYCSIGYSVILHSTFMENPGPLFREKLKNKLTVLTGPSGTGKSSLINRLNHNLNLETGTISLKTRRGKHTTRHAEILEVFPECYVLDTPGFSVLSLDFVVNVKEIKNYFPEFRKVAMSCRFLDCQHISEPDCAVKAFLASGEIARSRYDNYLSFVSECESQRRIR